MPVATSSEQLDESVIEEPIVASAGDTSARQLVDTAIGALHSSMQGEHRKPSQMFHSVGLSLDASIPEKVKTKIFNNEYIDFCVLISNHLAGEDKYQISIVNGRSGQPSLFFESSNKPKPIVNIEGWMSAFRIFVTVYTRKYPADAPALMKYGDLIQDLASRSHNWKFYDENFRFMRQSQPEAYPWGTVQWELWLRSQVTPRSSQSTPATSQPQGSKVPKYNAIPKGYCYRFQRGKECSGCAYKHVCFKCNGNHGGCSAIFVPQRDQPQPHLKQSHNLPTPINADRLRNFLVGYTPPTVEFLYAGFTKGFPLHFEGEFLSFEAENLLSASHYPDVVFF